MLLCINDWWFFPIPRMKDLIGGFPYSYDEA